MAATIQPGDLDLYKKVKRAINDHIDEQAVTLSSKPSNGSWNEQWWWIYILAPVLITVLTLGMVQIGKFDATTLWLPMGISQLLIVNGVSFGIAARSFRSRRAQLGYHVALSIGHMLLMSPVALAALIISSYQGVQPELTSFVYNSAVFIVILTSSVNSYLITHTVGTAKGLVEFFLPTLPAAMGGSVEKLLPIVKATIDDVVPSGNRNNDLQYLKETAQAMIDSSGTRILPVLGLLGAVTLQFDGIIQAAVVSTVSVVSLSVWQTIVGLTKLILVLICLMLVFSMAHQTYIDVLIVQTIAHLQATSQDD